MNLKVDGGSETSGSKVSDLDTPKERENDRQWLRQIGKTIWTNFKENFASWIITIIAIAILTLFTFHYGLDKELAVFKAKIEFIQKKVDYSETAYKEDVQNEIKISKCKNGAILECYNKCGLQEVIKRQNACELTK